MSVKILIDSLVTSTLSRCSTFIQTKTYLDRTIQGRDDVFFYVLVPDWEHEPEDWDWMIEGLPPERVKFIKVPQFKDRTREYMYMSPEREDHVAFNGETWDFDILITNRTGVSSLYRMFMHRPSKGKLRLAKEIWIIENMPLMSFKDSVAYVGGPIQDRWTLEGYLQADRVMVMSYHEKAGILESARQHMTPSQVRVLSKKIKEVIPVQFSDYQLKKPEFFYESGKGNQFCISFVGRMAAVGSGLDTVYEIMEKQWIIRPEDTVRLLVSTVSQKEPAKITRPEQVELVQAPRDEFWRLTKEVMHVGLMFFSEAGFLLSMMEPIMMGTPIMVIDKPWSRQQLGPDYPFYVKNMTEAYAWVKAFYEDYEGTYQRFAEWHQGWLVPEYTKRFEEDLLYAVLDSYLAQYEQRYWNELPQVFEAKETNSVVQLLDGPTDFVLFDRLRDLAKEGEVGNLVDKLRPGDRHKRNLTFATEFNEFRLGLKMFHGYEDASTVVGHLRKK